MLTIADGGYEKAVVPVTTLVDGSPAIFRWGGVIIGVVRVVRIRNLVGSVVLYLADGIIFLSPEKTGELRYRVFSKVKNKSSIRVV